MIYLKYPHFFSLLYADDTNVFEHGISKIVLWLNANKFNGKKTHFSIFSFFPISE